MKRNIVVCCGDMLFALIHGAVYHDSRLSITAALTTQTEETRVEDFTLCPWCGAKLPFEFIEEEKDGEKE